MKFQNRPKKKKKKKPPNQTKQARKRAVSMGNRTSINNQYEGHCCNTKTFCVCVKKIVTGYCLKT